MWSRLGIARPSAFAPGLIATSVLLLQAGVATPAFGEGFVALGARAMGMGGAGVAVTRGSLAAYWNPAALAPPQSARSSWDLSLGASAEYAATRDVFEKIDRLKDEVATLDFDQLEADLTAGNQLSSEQLRKILRIADSLPELGEPGTGLLLQGGAGLGGRVGTVSLSAVGLFYGGGAAKIDRTGLALGDQGLGTVLGPGGNSPSTSAGQALADRLAAQGLATQAEAEELVFQAEQAGIDVADTRFQGVVEDLLEATQANVGGSPSSFFTANQSGADLRGILVQEYGISYAVPLFGLVSVGATAKLMYGMTYFRAFRLREAEGLDELFSDLTESENREESLNFGLDVGILAQPFDFLSVGVVARNINQPSFDFKGPGRYTLDPQLRAGVGITPITGLTLAADLDLLVNESEALPGYDSQQVAVGLEYALLGILYLRAGLSDNLAESEEDPVVHAGLGLRVFSVEVDLAAMVGTDFTEIETSTDGSPDKAPERGGLAVLFSINVPLP